MAKGQKIGVGAPAPTDTASGRPKGMLPPGSGAPIEVTKDWLGQETTTSDTPAPPALPAQAAPTPQTATTVVVPAVDLPPPDAPVEVILAECERIILAANIELRDAERKAVSAWMGTVGPAVRLVHSTKAYKTMLDSRDRPYKSFARWALERCGISRPHAYRMVNEGPVAEALAPLNVGAQLATRQVDVLAPVLRQHGEEAVRTLWSTAQAAGNTGAVQLAVTRDALKLTVRPEDFEPEKQASPESISTALVRVHKAAHGVDRDTLRRAALSDPEAARRAVAAARQFADDLQLVLKEIGDAEQ